MKLLIKDSAILAAGEMLVTDDYIRTYTADGKADAEYPLHVIPGWQIVDVDVPEDFTPAGYVWAGAEAVPKLSVPPLPPVPQEILMYQGRAALIQAGRMQQLTDFLATLPGVEGEMVRAYFEFSPTLRRDHRFIVQLAPMLGWSETGVDMLFRLAATF